LCGRTILARAPPSKWFPPSWPAVVARRQWPRRARHLSPRLTLCSWRLTSIAIKSRNEMRRRVPATTLARTMRRARSAPPKIAEIENGRPHSCRACVPDPARSRCRFIVVYKQRLSAGDRGRVRGASGAHRGRSAEQSHSAKSQRCQR